MIQQNHHVSAGRPAVKPRPTPGGEVKLPENKGHGTKPAFDKPSFGHDGFKPACPIPGGKGEGMPGIKPGGPFKLPDGKGFGDKDIKPGGPYKLPEGSKLPGDLGLPKGEPGPIDKGIQPIGPFKVGEGIKKLLEKFKPTADE